MKTVSIGNLLELRMEITNQKTHTDNRENCSKSDSVRLDITSELEHKKATSCGQDSKICEAGFKNTNTTSAQEIAQPEISESVQHETPQENKQKIACDTDKKEDENAQSSEFCPDKANDIQHVGSNICKDTQTIKAHTIEKQKQARSCSI